MIALDGDGHKFMIAAHDVQFSVDASNDSKHTAVFKHRTTMGLEYRCKRDVCGSMDTQSRAHGVIDLGCECVGQQQYILYTQDGRGKVGEVV